MTAYLDSVGEDFLGAMVSVTRLHKIVHRLEEKLLNLYKCKWMFDDIANEHSVMLQLGINQSKWLIQNQASTESITKFD